MRRNTVTKRKITELDKMVNDLLDEQQANYREWLRGQLLKCGAKVGADVSKKSNDISRFSEYLKI